MQAGAVAAGLDPAVMRMRWVPLHSMEDPEVVDSTGQVVMACLLLIMIEQDTEAAVTEATAAATP